MQLTGDLPVNLEKLVRLMEQLRGENGCPWDKKQTRNSLKPYIIEEAYELVEAIESGNVNRIKEELGDLLFQIIFQCQIAKENKEFNIFDVIDEITDKMIKRHPHVFGDMKLKTPEEVLSQWEVQKKSEGKMRQSILEGIPVSLPSLLKALRLQKRVAQVGFDWRDINDVIRKLDEEINEFKKALEDNKPEKIEEELGDILFMIVNVSRFVGVNPEDALRKTIDKFIERFQYIEKKASERGIELSNMTLEEMDNLWDEAKLKLK